MSLVYETYLLRFDTVPHIMWLLRKILHPEILEGLVVEPALLTLNTYTT